MLVLIIIFIFSALTRFCNLHIPNNISFDEYYFGWYITSYISRWFTWDIHPPLSRLIMAILAYIGGYRGTIDYRGFNYRHFSDKVYYQLRSIPASFSALVPPTTFITARLFNFSLFSSISISLFTLFDTCLIAEGHIILTDPFLHFFSVLAMASLPGIAQSHPLTKEWYKNMIFSSIAMSCAISTKWTSGGILITQIFFHFLDLSYRYWKQICQNGLFSKIKELSIRFFFLIIFPTIIVISACTLHMSTFVYTSSMSETLPYSMQNQLFNNNETINWTQHVLGPSMIEKGTKIFKLLFSYTTGNSSDFISSQWYEWPLLLNKWLCFGTNVYSFGQPFVWPPLFIITCIASITVAYHFFRGKMNRDYGRLLVFLVSYWMSYIPFLFVTRTVYLYHYCIPSIMSAFSSLCFLDIMLPRKVEVILVSIMVILACFGYFFFCGFIYGLDIPKNSFRYNLVRKKL